MYVLWKDLRVLTIFRFGVEGSGVGLRDYGFRVYVAGFRRLSLGVGL